MFLLCSNATYGNRAMHQGMGEMRDLTELNFNVGGEPFRIPGPADETIAAFEQAFGVKLPSEYQEFLRFSNGGFTELGLFVPEGPVVGDDYGEVVEGVEVNNFFSLTADRSGPG